MTVIVQITPEIGPGTGVGAVAHHLEQEWTRLGLDVRHFSLSEAGGEWLPRPGGGVRGRLALIARVVWFSTVGTRRARAYLRAHPEQLSVCHNDVVAGDVYVNHGIVQAAMKARGHYRLRMLRNPLHLFTTTRDRLRYSRRGSHRVVVNLVSAEEALLRQSYPRLAIPTVVIGNGVDIERFRPPTPEERSEARASLGRSSDERVVLFIGNEFGRKGLPVLVEAMAGLDDRTHLHVVGGTPDLVAQASSSAAAAGLADRVHFDGPHADPRPWLHAADVLVMPSAYESFGLVVLEALASGVPVVATPTGCVPDLVADGVNGAVVEATPAAVVRGLVAVLDADAAELARHARATAEEHSWSRVARRYLDLLGEVRGVDPLGEMRAVDPLAATRPVSNGSRQ
ncbi:UDP-glucose:(heptosyl)LPS alpha-1,3-glucosyltransferase [Humibacillus xanthopallidus]|uniref:UDP-glucose:(Heptosyl)LPS alpha-1,3-glucosyltransferase n=1 Tax=Humibacillus xanthopallidus TaxID=412689 RepID=A0A543PXG0_9MICO|nr:glycosyltransferase family 4 protein [Humibacillus xanthopallidus]TQN48762.1 UDP-glucose:(heptosyl)LPS alpha-1,3-glucosyltransferase [Humibacillus xanthopallidus]